MSTHALWIALFLIWGFTWGSKLLRLLGKSFVDCPTCRSPVRKGQIRCHNCLGEVSAGSLG